MTEITDAEVEMWAKALYAEHYNLAYKPMYLYMARAALTAARQAAAPAPTDETERKYGSVPPPVVDRAEAAATAITSMIAALTPPTASQDFVFRARSNLVAALINLTKDSA